MDEEAMKKRSQNKTIGKAVRWQMRVVIVDDCGCVQGSQSARPPPEVLRFGVILWFWGTPGITRHQAPFDSISHRF